MDDIREQAVSEGRETGVTAASMSAADERFLTAAEALLFAAHEPLPATILSATNGHKGWSLDQVIQQINYRLATGGHPMRVRRVAGGYQMHLLPEFAPIVDAHLVKTRTQRLSRAGLETLAIIAYRQPCSTPVIERVRGVACDGVLRTLLERNLVTIKGRSEAPGRPLLYVTTRDFLRYFGLNSLDELPAEDELDALLSTRSGADGENPLLFPRSIDAAEDDPGLFGTVVLHRGPESDQAARDRRFVIEGVVDTPAGGGEDDRSVEDGLSLSDVREFETADDRADIPTVEDDRRTSALDQTRVEEVAAEPEPGRSVDQPA